jgi:hypothetical protein
VSEAKQAALDYLAQGWSVFPLHERSKAPAVQWSRYQLERPSKEDVSTWGETCGVAIVTGRLSGLVVVDFDPKKGGNSREWLQKYPTNCLVETGTGGVHAYYLYPYGEEVRNATNYLPGVDIRGEGGYVVAPPSVHPNGQGYSWILRGTPAPLPEEVKHRVKEETTNQPGWVSELLQGAPEGTRDDSAAKLAGWLHAKGVNKADAKSWLALWNTRNQPPLHGADIVKTVDSVYRTADRSAAQETVASALRPASELGFQLEDFGAYMARYADVVTPWIVKEWLPAKTIAFVISPPGTYKTWTVLDLAISVATGTKFLGKYEVNAQETGPVILVQQEDYHGQTVQRLSVIMHERYSTMREGAIGGDSNEFKVQLPPNPQIKVHTERRLRFEDKKAMREFAEAVEAVRPKLVILDPLYSAGSTDDYMAKTAEHMFIFKDLRDRFGTSFLVCHHTKKSGDATARDRVWGSQFLNAFLETGWQLSSAGDKAVRIKRHFKSAADPQEIVIEWDINTEPGTYRYRPEVIDSVKDYEKPSMANALKGEVPDDPADPERFTYNTVSVPVPAKPNKVTMYLQQFPGQRFDRHQLAKALGIDVSGVNRYLQGHVREGTIIKNGNHYVFPG